MKYIIGIIDGKEEVVPVTQIKNMDRVLCSYYTKGAIVFDEEIDAQLIRSKNVVDYVEYYWD